MGRPLVSVLQRPSTPSASNATTRVLCVQTLHVGGYDDEAPVLEAMHNQFIPDASLRMTGKHHEVYLSDSRRTPPDKLKTILRQPVAQDRS